MQHLDSNATLSPSNPAHTTPNQLPNDKILLTTRVIAVSFTVVSLLVFIVLYLFPSNTDTLFAWTIRPDLTAMFIGAAYFSGFYLFLFVVFASRWHRIHTSFLPLSAFVTFQAIATYSHLDRFHQGHPVFYLWIGLYTILPIAVPLVWLRNRGADPHTPELDDVLLSVSTRWISGILGGIIVMLALILLIAPDLIINIWAWKLTPLTARVIGGCFAFSGCTLLHKAFEVRWSAVRLTQQSQLLWSALILVAIVRAWGDFDQAKIVTWLFIAIIILLFVTSLITYITMENRRRQNSAQITLTLPESLAAN